MPALPSLLCLLQWVLSDPQAMGNASISACLIPAPQNAGFALTLIAEHAQKCQEFLPTNRQRQISQPTDVYTCIEVQIHQQFLTYFFLTYAMG